MLVLKLSGFDLSVVHLALSGSEVGGSARFCNKMNLKGSSTHFHAWKVGYVMCPGNQESHLPF